jgi:hypothetical protein
MASNFRVELTDLPTSYVSKVEPGTMNRSGQGVTFDNWKVTMLSQDSDQQVYHDLIMDSIIYGLPDPLQINLIYLDPTFTNEVRQISCSETIPIKVSTPKLEANKEDLFTFTVELTVDDCKFS